MRQVVVFIVNREGEYLEGGVHGRGECMGVGDGERSCLTVLGLVELFRSICWCYSHLCGAQPDHTVDSVEMLL